MEFLHNMGQFFSQFGVWGLALNSFVESFFLVPPPDFLLIAMDLNEPNRALYFATMCTIASVIGGAVGFAIGKWLGRPAFDWIFSGLQKKGNNKAKEYFDKVEALYNQYGAWAVFFAAFTPIPYKVFIGRGMRFYIVSIVLMIFGEKIKNNLELVILGVTLLIVVFFVILYKKRHSFTKPKNETNIPELCKMNKKEEEKDFCKN